MRMKVESFRPGYPRWSALVASHHSFAVFRRFHRLRMRLLLLKQDQLAVKDARLREIDEAEKWNICLARSRSDSNAERITLLEDTERLMMSYDALLEKTARAMAYNSASPRAVASLQNWVNGNRCITREETAFLHHLDDLIEICPTSDDIFVKLESWVEDGLLHFYKGFRQLMTPWQRPGFDVSVDPHVHIYSGSLIRRLARMVFVLLTTSLLTVPIVACNSVGGTAARIAIIIASNVLIQAVFGSMAKSKMLELFVAGAT
ncbi:predicted protein [Chaetomium globosum CBS 148.51]|uniref:DUF6594 domain-containing protein n=1 Tax=Chaetomium globosum (strain ATCC 6205 / CBS 148.51 / DSM 1962 / NBRC 6347 / NRRL 1970) TaxID=306901 RepID=Q2HHJ0_CHAGB|nr:uncharacterized protein CHGG_00314 [Chaetomium globosum CBS 148.51]EAQ92079.1 predicted protein [Chaetomium globosum CBS 148.51]